MVKNTPKSIKQKLLNRARKEKISFNELTQYYAMERFLYRLSQSKYCDSFILKGGLMFHIWQGDYSRPTMDIDMLGKVTNDEKKLREIIKEVLNIKFLNDGLSFNSEDLKTENITENSDYKGIRVIFYGLLDTVKFKIQLDIGFGDIVIPKTISEKLNCLLDFPQTKLHCYTKESCIAEKFETIIKKDEINSRIKDYYDIWFLINNYEFDKNILKHAIETTLKNRKTEVPNIINGLSKEFADKRQAQWIAFSKKINDVELSKDFNQIILKIKTFVNTLNIKQEKIK